MEFEVSRSTSGGVIASIGFYAKNKGGLEASYFRYIGTEKGSFSIKADPPMQPFDTLTLDDAQNFGALQKMHVMRDPDNKSISFSQIPSFADYLTLIKKLTKLGLLTQEQANEVVAHAHMVDEEYLSERLENTQEALLELKRRKDNDLSPAVLQGIANIYGERRSLKAKDSYTIEKGRYAGPGKAVGGARSIP